MAAGCELARAAAALLGVSFRLHGRDRLHGLDCMGLVEAALTAAGHPARLPLDYALKMRSIDRFAGAAERAGLVAAKDAIRPGDILLLKVGPGQHHLGIMGMDDKLIHAHAGLRRVVSSPLPQGDIMERWRLSDSD
jgi:cell wall-associated NlpC family hydrolase